MILLGFHGESVSMYITRLSELLPSEKSLIYLQHEDHHHRAHLFLFM